MRIGETVDDYGDDYGSRGEERVPASTVVVAAVVHRKVNKMAKE